MITISFTTDVTSFVRKCDVWNQIRTIENYPNVLDQIDSVTILKSIPPDCRSEWFITLDGAPFSWVELDTFLPEEYCYRFKAISGDFDQFSGVWKIGDTHETGGISLACSMNFELGIPVIEENCGDVLKEKFQYYLETLVKNHVAALQAHAIDERRFGRVRVGRPCMLDIDDRGIEADVLDFSRGGMSMCITKGMVGSNLKQPVHFKFGTMELQGRLFFDQHYHIHRVHFNEPLDESSSRVLFTEWTQGSAASAEEMVAICEVLTAPATAAMRLLSKKHAR